jgi:hypothetical protein
MNAMKTKQYILIEAMEERVMLSVTDLNPNFGDGGTLGNPISEPNGYYSAFSAADGDVLAVDSYSTMTSEDEPPTYSAKIADVEADGSTRWVAAFNSPMDDAWVSVIRAAKLPDGGAVVATQEQPGNDAFSYLAWIHADGSIAADQSLEGYTTAIDPLADGSVVVASMPAYNPEYFELARFDSAGTTLTAYDAHGFITSDGINRIYAVAEQSDGKIIVAGNASVAYGSRQHLALERFNMDGSIDTTFGDGGTYIARSGITPTNLIIGSNDEIYVTGASGIWAFNADGQVDSNFQLGTAFSNISDSKLASDGSLYIASYTGYQPTIAHLAGDGSLLDIAEGSSEFTDAIDEGFGFLATDLTGQLFAYSKTGDVQEAVGLSVNQPTGDTTAPSANLGRLRRIPAGASTYEFDVTYVDTESGIDNPTIQNSTVFLRFGRHKFDYGTLVSNRSFGSDNSIATYLFTAPSGAWLNDAGTYTIETAADEVTDNAGNGVPLQVLGSFTIKPEKQASAVQISIPTLQTAAIAPSWLESDGAIL